MSDKKKEDAILNDSEESQSTNKKEMLKQVQHDVVEGDSATKSQNDNIKNRYFPSQIEKKWQKMWEEAGLYKFEVRSVQRAESKEQSAKDSNKIAKNSGLGSGPYALGKYYTLVELPYPSGDLHIGHWFTFVAPDVLSRFKRMQGYNVFFPMGYDAFGLPAENAAIKRGVHPKDWTEKNIETMTKQFETMGTMIDWDHVTITCKPEYYKWNQWIFQKMYERGIAYRGKKLSNWCPVDQTVLANEHVEDGKCWRCGSVVIQKEVEQWFLKITDYADRLLWSTSAASLTSVQSRHSSGVPSPVTRNTSDTFNDQSPIVNASTIDWPKSVMVAQNEWIGKKEGIEITYPVVIGESDVISNASERSPEGLRGARNDKNDGLSIAVFTTRPDTNFGATFVAIAPEHPLVEEILNHSTQYLLPRSGAVQDDGVRNTVRTYVKKASEKTELERKEEGKEKTGVFTGAYAINHLTGYKMPIWVSDFVLMNFGTGALVGVPAHDERDFQFASKFGLEIKRVVVGNDGDTSEITSLDQVQEEEGTMVNSDFLNGMDVHSATEKMMDYLEEKGWGKRVVNYHLHDWSVSRQRYWGTPVPMIHCEKDGIVPVPEDQLPVELPYDVDYQPKGKAPLASNEEWMRVVCPKCGGPARRDPETLDTFFDSSWYYYRYVDPKYDKAPFDPDRVAKLMPVDIYFGGGEHTLGHTLYARFFTKFFKDLGMVDFEEFALKRIQHGIVLGPDGNKMSKSKGNVINPDDVVKEFGTDAVRVYLSFMMPYNTTGPWSTTAMYGMFKFLKRVWELQEKVQNVIPAEGGAASEKLVLLGEIQKDGSPIRSGMTREDLFHMNTTIKKVGDDIASTKFNTAVAEMMKWLNYLEGKGVVTETEYKNLLLILAPFAPHITEELWQKLVMSDESGEVEGSHEISPRATLGRNDKFHSIHQEAWPEVDEVMLTSHTATIVVQVNGKVRASMSVEGNASAVKETIEQLAKEHEKVKPWLEGKEIRQTIFVPQKLINFVV